MIYIWCLNIYQSQKYNVMGFEKDTKDAKERQCQRMLK